MKTAVYFKRFLSAFTALSFVCIVSSCKDQDFDWDAAHALTAQEKFTDVFIKEFGKPAEGHLWGFDFAWAEGPGSSTSATRAVYTDGHVLKADQGGVDACDTRDYYGSAANITEREHKEVYEWFATHKVTWTSTTNIIGTLVGGDKLYKSDGTEVTYYAKDGKFEASDYSVIIGGKVISASNIITNGDFIVNQNGNSDSLRIVQLVSGTGTRNSGLTIEAKKTADLSQDNSLRTYTPDCVGDYNVGLTINFNHAWIQHVASDRDSKVPDRVKEKNLKGALVNTYDTNGKLAGTNMDFLQFFFNGDSEAHTNDFNGQGGWGWNNQSSTFTEGDRVYPMNGVLMLGGNFNNTTYKCSLGNNPSAIHDKWIVVYLAGEDYAGWYLGFDFESVGDGWDKQVGANGYCTNWIIKLGAVDPAQKPEKSMIMCEDLGGFNNTVKISDSKTMKSDVDYNDIVFNVTPTKASYTYFSYYPENDWVVKYYYSQVEIELLAAGGTLPLTVWYGNTPLFETHEMFQKSACWAEKPSDVDYTIMYNTNSSATNSKNNVPRKKITLYFKKDNENVIKDGNNHIIGFNFKTEDFDINDIELKVWRHDVADYKGQQTSVSVADWINLSNVAGQAPIKLCIDQGQAWADERQPIDQKYPKFMDWVKDFKKPFWK